MTEEVMAFPEMTFGDVGREALQSIEHRLPDRKLESLLSTVRLFGCSCCSRNIVSIDFYRNKPAKRMMTYLSWQRCVGGCSSSEVHIPIY